ncbi:amino acid ABC transporter ATP-binding protein [Enterococcus xiangfangensis]|uniref:Amino acid ABC transporter ATP-binding protein n=1 Tax=Enterococcus xiangfangensis TaxID=1296537 RepID=A0ABU3F8T1_9ENTE|nr:amino acid ABC transporter ATP-binding protein [Enterococcus xiangfangensis]MBM7710867.1 polar amino acid transport system ATP-binding protein [Enterococcus xiangfangensis]MDT2759064.1 amino acid ABC transporter ATP-binding protein [Enterococcus xiangfangensis]NBK07931.1 amino acid ABC transporter ATP-binding protein [Enterococcus asini]
MIEIKGLSKSFGTQKVIDDIELEIETGDVVALIGSSGAGKSTFLRTLNYLEKADHGKLVIDDFSVDFSTITKNEILELRRRTAMVFQQFALFERKTAIQNVMEGLVIVKGIDKQTAYQQAAAELANVGLEDRSEYYPQQLSGGQQQRVAIARSLAMKPRLLLLDEPTSALDPELVQEVLTTIKGAAEAGQTMVLVSHEMDFVYEVATKVLFLEKGKIIESGPTKEVFHRPQHPRTQEFLRKFS